MRSNLLALAIAVALSATSVQADAANRKDTAAQAAAQAAADQAAARAQEVEALKAQLAQLQAQVAALEERTDAQSDINVSTQQNVEKLQDSAKDSDKLAKLVNDTKVSGKMYFDLTNVDQTKNGAKTSASGTGFDVKRFYLSVDHKFDDTWSANLTTDFNYVSNDGETNLFVKKAYVQGKFSDALVFRAGSADLPWVPFAEGFYGFRYVENTLIDRLKFGTSADWGVHLGGKSGDGMFNYAASVINGAGYKNPSRGKSMDFEGRIGFSPIQDVTIAVGAYSGKLGKETQTTSTLHTANRTDFLAAYAHENVRFGVEYFEAKNWNNVLTVASDKANGYSLWGSYGFDNGMTVFTRYDEAKLSKTLDPSLKDTYYNFGLEFPIRKGFKMSAVYKHDRLKNDTTTNTKTDEIGVWGEVAF